MARALRSEPLQTVAQMAALGDLVEVDLPLSPVRIYFLNSPSLVDEMLVKQHRVFKKRMRGYDVMKQVIGNGLVTSEDTLWAKQRRLMTPAFGRASMAGFATTIVEKTERFAAELADGAAIDVHADMLRLALDVIGQTLLSTDMSEGGRDFSQALNEVLGQMIWRALQVVPIPLAVPTPANLRFRRAKRTLDTIIHSIIDERLQGGMRGDLLDMLLAATDPESGAPMSREQLTDEIMTLFFAGHETTASALTWLFAALAERPEVERAALAELQSVVGDRAVSADDLPKLPYLGAVIKECLRLSPPVWMVPRVAVEATELEGVSIAQGSYIFCSPYFLHRRAQEWQNANEFLPERWLAPGFRAPRGAYIPFLQGARRCIGEGFATMEITLVVATLLKRFRFERTTPGAVELAPEVTLKPREGLPMRVIRRGQGR